MAPDEDQPDGGASAPPTLSLLSPRAMDEAEAQRRAISIANVLRVSSREAGLEHIATHLLLAFESGRAAGIAESLQALHEAKLGGVQMVGAGVPFTNPEDGNG